MLPIFQVRRDWTDFWQYDYLLELERCVISGRGDQVGELRVRRPYAPANNLNKEWETGFRADDTPPADYSGYYIRMGFFDEIGNYVPVWMGVVDEDIRSPQAQDAQSGLYGAGWQRLIAFDGAHILRKIDVSRSRWHVQRSASPAAKVEQEIDFIPDMNFVDARNLRVGNRSTVIVGDTTDLESFIYDGESQTFWSRWDYLGYVLTKWCQGAADGSVPRFFLGGDASAIDALKQMTDYVRMGQLETAHDVIRRLVHPGVGLDFMVRPIFVAGTPPTDAFEIDVYSIFPNDIAWNDAVLQGNTNHVEIKTDDLLEVETRPTVTRSSRNTVDRVRVAGSRIIQCVTLGYITNDLVPKWTAALEAEYNNILAEDPDASLEELDAARQTDRFRAVYQQFGAPVDWTVDYPSRYDTSWVVGDDGAYVSGGGDFQNTVRRTLPWVPLAETIQYFAGGDNLDENLSGHTPERLPPMAWALHEELLAWYPVDSMPDANMHVYAANDDWGVRLAPRINHILGLNFFTGDSEIEPEYDYSTLVATIAFESDQRVEMVAEFVPTANVRYEKVIDVPDAETWVLAPNTVWGVNKYGELKDTGGLPIAVRNDISKLNLPMAGALARYGFDRQRAEIPWMGYQMLHGLLGQILSVIEDHSVLHYVGSPITGLVYEAKTDRTGRTVLRAGWAE